MFSMISISENMISGSLGKKENEEISTSVDTNLPTQKVEIEEVYDILHKIK